ncbi:MAG: peptidoglycan-associated lipoprotein Pal [Candidatus Eisenbacteria bacterium]|nr:peptidoglycan-associated lipoprotein Pal [Candidatus Eisenbacteria bacterium]
MRRGVVLLLVVAFAAGVVFGLSGCAGRKPTEEPVVEPEVSEETDALTGEDIPLPDVDDTVFVEPLSPEFENIHFEFDRYDIRPVDEPILESIASWLEQHEDVKVLIEGHCDERGTNEYNMALGEQRALAARRYLVSLGVEAQRLSTISYGEERPLDPRSTEEAWAKNRRAHFTVSD